MNCKWFPLSSSLHQFLIAPIEKKSFFIILLVYLAPGKWTEKCGTNREHLKHSAPEGKSVYTRKCKQAEQSPQPAEEKIEHLIQEQCSKAFQHPVGLVGTETD